MLLPALKRQMCDLGHRMWLRGFCAGNDGNHSVRLSPDRVLCTPTGMSKGFMEPADLLIIDMEGQPVRPNARGRKVTSEIKLHLGVYGHRSDVKAVVHSHPPHTVAFAIAGRSLPKRLYPEADYLLGDVPIARYALPSTHDLPQSVVDVIGPQTNSVIMANHGPVCFSSSLLDAYYKLEVLEAYCRIVLLTAHAGTPRKLSTQQWSELMALKKRNLAAAAAKTRSGERYEP